MYVHNSVKLLKYIANENNLESNSLQKRGTLGIRASPREKKYLGQHLYVPAGTSWQLSLENYLV